VLTTPKTSPSAKNRYLYYPDHLVRMPGPGTGVGELVSSLLSEKIWRGVLSGPLREYFRPPRPADMEDESIGSFLRRRFSTPMADNIVSAVLHGIYAGDINKLSVKTLMPSMWNLEGEHGSVIRGAAHNMWHKRTNMTRTDYDLLKRLDKYWHDKNGAMLPEVEKLNQIIGSSIYTFRAGLEQLPRALVEELEAAPNVTIRRGVRVRAIERKDGLSTRKVRIVAAMGDMI
jgi:protoporphyrinogen oxidase